MIFPSNNPNGENNKLNNLNSCDNNNNNNISSDTDSLKSSIDSNDDDLSQPKPPIKKWYKKIISSFSSFTSSKNNGKSEDSFSSIDFTLSSKNNSLVYNIAIVFLVLFLSECARGLVMPSTPSYVTHVGGDSTFLGLVISSFSLGRFISTILLGYLSSKLKYRKVFIGSVAICIVGSFIYCFAYLDPNGAIGKSILIISRLLLGFGAGTLSAVRAYIAEVSKPSERTTYIAYLAIVQFIGFAVTPILGSAIQYIPKFEASPIFFNNLTSSGWFLSIFNSLLFFILIFQFSNPVATSNDVTSTTTTTTTTDDEKKLVEKEKLNITPNGDENNNTTTATTDNNQISLIKLLINDKKALKSLIIFVILNFFVRGILGIYETLGTPIYQHLIGDKTDSTSGLYFGGIGIIGIVILILISIISKKQWIDDIWILLTGNAIILVACAICITTNLGWVQFTISSVLIFGFGYPLAQTLIVSMFSKQLSSSIGKQSQGSMMGIIGAAGSLGRICGPLISGMMFNDNLNTFTVFCFASSLALVTLFISFLILPHSFFFDLVSKLKQKIGNFNSFIRLNRDDDFDIITLDNQQPIKDEDYYKI